MFQLVENRKIWWPVVWNSPVDGGKSVEAKIEMRFILMSPDDTDAIVQAATAMDNDSEDTRPQSERKAELLMPLIDDWKGIGDEDKKPIPFDEAALARFFRLPGTFYPTLNAFGACMAGMPEERRKN